MKASKFKRGDKVITSGKLVGEVIEINYMWGLPRVKIKYDFSKLVADLDEDDVQFHYEDLVEKSDKPLELGERCPKCKKSWTKTNFGSRIWLDCVPCGKKAEDLVKEFSSNKKKSQDTEDLESSYNIDLWGRYDGGL